MPLLHQLVGRGREVSLRRLGTGRRLGRASGLLEHAR